MVIEKNLQLRSRILEIALDLEHNVNLFLLRLLLIENEKRKAISNKSGTLSFKNKIDLLFDLDFLTNEEHKTFLLVMEFRNQFLHNIDCNSFQSAVTFLGTDKEKSLLKFNELKDNSDKELQYKNAYENLYLKTTEILLQKINDRKNQIENRRSIHANQEKLKLFLIDKYFDLIDKVLEICEKSDSINREVTELMNLISQTVANEIEVTFSSKEYNKIRKENQELYTPERLKNYFNR